MSPIRWCLVGHGLGAVAGGAAQQRRLVHHPGGAQGAVAVLGVAVVGFLHHDRAPHPLADDPETLSVPWVPPSDSL
ncbi:hypothetical protein ABL57_12925 [Kocuria sp. SM24M-10]|nr:hypothetical protein ABL57_12925 [Kocuria sp. SM24M-10]